MPGIDPGSNDAVTAERAPTPLASRGDLLIAATLALATFVLLMATMGIGVPRDESFYYHAAVEYVGWFNEMWANLQQRRGMITAMPEGLPGQ